MIIEGIVGPELSHAPSRGFEIIVSLAPGSWDDDVRKSSFLVLWKGHATTSMVVVLLVVPNKGTTSWEAM